jgi:hypothetical protein
MRKLLPSLRPSWKQAMFLDLLVGLMLISADAFGQSAAGSPNQMMTPANSADGAKQLVSRTEIIYQGQLREHGMPANGAYDIKFILYPSQTGGNELGSAVYEDIAVINGQFTAKLDFGRATFDSKESWLEVSIRHGFSTDAYTSLSPRQRLTPTPYAILAQQQAWSLIGVPVGYVEGLSATNTIDQYNNDEQRKDESPGKETSTDLAVLAAPNFLAKFNASGNPAGQSIIFDNGSRLGVSTTNPAAKLHINGTGIDNNGSTAVVRITSGSGGQHLLLDGNEIDAVADGLFLNNNTNQNIVLANGGGRVGIGTLAPESPLHVIGTITSGNLVSGGVDAFTGRFDFLSCGFCTGLAGSFEIAGGEAIKPGMVVAIDSASAGRLRLTDKAYDRAVAGIVSGANGINPGLLTNSKNATAGGSLPIALNGSVYCWADASNGPINPGDLLTSSNTPGHAMRVTDSTKAQGAIIGKALTSLTEGAGLILVLVTLQ